MQEPTFLILTALAAAPQHGYGIMADVRRISSGRVRLRLQIAPVDQLTEGLLDSLHRGRATWPNRFGKHIVGSKMQTELALRGREDIENCAVHRRVLCYDMAEQSRRGARQHGR